MKGSRLSQGLEAGILKRLQSAMSRQSKDEIESGKNYFEASKIKEKEWPAQNLRKRELKELIQVHITKVLGMIDNHKSRNVL